MARKANSFTHTVKKHKKRPGVHSKCTTRSQSGFRKKYRGQGR